MTLNIGDAAPAFELQNSNATEGLSMMNLENSRGENGLIVVFECNHCPYVIASISRLEAMSGKSNSLGIGFVGINSNDPDNYPSDNWEHMLKRGAVMSYPYLHDPSQEIAHAWGAERTPEFYLLDGNGIITYRGRLDDSPRDPNLATTSELSDAIDALLADESPDVARTDSIGCSVKWKV